MFGCKAWSSWPSKKLQSRVQATQMRVLRRIKGVKDYCCVFSDTLQLYWSLYILLLMQKSRKVQSTVDSVIFLYRLNTCMSLSHRNLDHHSRPSLSELCSSLKDHSDRGGPSLLDVPVEAVREPARADATLRWAQDQLLTCNRCVCCTKIHSITILLCIALQLTLTSHCMR